MNRKTFLSLNFRHLQYTLKNSVAVKELLSISMISLLLHKSEVKTRTVVNNKAMASGYVHLTKLPLSLTIYSFDFFSGDIYL